MAIVAKEKNKIILTQKIKSLNAQFTPLFIINSNVRINPF